MPIFNQKGLLPGQLYHAANGKQHPNQLCLTHRRRYNHLCLMHVFQERLEVKVTSPNIYYEQTDPNQRFFLKWRPEYENLIYPGITLNELIHNLIQYSKTVPYKSNWYQNIRRMELLPDPSLEFDSIIKQIFDPIRVQQEIITDDWQPCRISGRFDLTGTRRFTPNKHGELEGFYKRQFVLTPWQ